MSRVRPADPAAVGLRAERTRARVAEAQERAAAARERAGEALGRAVVALEQARGAQAARLEALRAEIARRQAGPERKRERRWGWLLLALLLLLLLLRPCHEEVVPVVEAPAPVVVEAAPAPPAAPPEPRARAVSRRPRPAFSPGPTEALPWVAAFRLQVAARAPRLAACFTGAARPGALKWSGAVEPVRGSVSEQSVEPTLASDELTSEQRACVLAVLADPPYRLDAAGAPSTPVRVGVVVEF